MTTKTKKNITVILKTVERCNLNCSYCYFFNGADQSYKGRPKFVSKDTILSIANFLSQGACELDIDTMQVVLHGGEPLMQPKEDFAFMVRQIRDKVDSKVDLFFSLQTNGTLVTKEWVKLLNEHKIYVGVSFDGPKRYHDQYRVDHYGAGSYDQVVRGINLLQEGLFSAPGCLSVINPEIDPTEFYQEILNLGFTKLDLLFPDFNHNNPPPVSIHKYSNFVISVFDQWANNDNPEIAIRKFKSMIIQLLGGKSLVYGFGKINTDELPIISIRSAGEISTADELMSTHPPTVTFTGKNVATTSLREIITLDIFNEIKDAYTNVPIKCSKCCWFHACGSGGLVNRFDSHNRFNNHSVYCDGLQNIFAHICAYMIKSGIAQEAIAINLSIKLHKQSMA